MHDLAFADAARPSRVVCLRLLLQPYSVGHELLLWQARNPLLLSSQEDFDKLPTAQQIFALVRAVSICSRNWSENQKPERWVRLWGWLIRKTDWPVAIAEFRNYLREGRSLVPCLISEKKDDREAYEMANGEELNGKGRALGAPFLAQTMLFCASTLGMPLESIYDAPFALCGNLYFTQLESEGRVNIENVTESKYKQEMAEHRASIAAEKEKEQCPAQ